jgi:polyisoprenoid-binding protein YceI
LSWSSGFEIDVGFSISHFGISDVSGTFNHFEASISSDKEDFSDAVIAATIDVSSIDTRLETRDRLLKSVDFFDVAKYPNITFESTGLKKAGNNKYKVTGNLTVKRITKPVTLDLTYKGSFIDPASKRVTPCFNLSGVINRADFGVGDGYAYRPPALSDEVAININTEFR